MQGRSEAARDSTWRTARPPPAWLRDLSVQPVGPTLASLAESHRNLAAALFARMRSASRTPATNARQINLRSALGHPFVIVDGRYCKASDC
ncbi:hypothetical protein GCM10029978_046940 [Actinoallomurus acanthiterrae]